MRLPFYFDRVVLHLKWQMFSHNPRVFNLPVGQQGVCQRALGWAAAGTDFLTQS